MSEEVKNGGFLRKLGGALARFFKAVGSFIKRHKRLSVFIGVLLVGGAAALVYVSTLRGNTQAGGFTMPETTLLAKMDLELTVTATGTLESAETHEVTSDLSYDVEAVHVEVGDVVAAGELLATLDASDIEDAIADLKEDIAEAAADDAKALEKMARRLQEAYDDRDANYTKNNDAALDAKEDVEDAQAGEEKTKKARSTALDEIRTRLASLTGLAADSDIVKSITSQEDARRRRDEGKLDDAQLDAIENDAMVDWYFSDYADANRAHEEAKTATEAAQSAYDKAVESRDSAYENDTKTIETAQENYDEQAGKDSAESLRDELEDYQDQLNELSITAPVSGMVTEMTAEAGSSAGGSGGSGTGTTGTGSTGTGNTGSTASTALFTIESTELLRVPVQVAEYDAIGLKAGMSATITSDALEDESWSAVVTSVSPKASGGNFTVTVETTSPVGELAIGMSATVDIITEARQDVYAVPYDAVVTNASGETVVYALDTGNMGGSFGGMRGADGSMPNMDDLPEGGFPEGGFPDGSMPEGMGGMGRPGAAGDDTTGGASDDSGEDEGYSRIEIVVDTGLETDYYIEISGDELRDGMLILNDPLGINVQATTSEGLPEMSGGFTMGGGMGGGGMGGGGPAGGGGPPA